MNCPAEAFTMLFSQRRRVFKYIYGEKKINKNTPKAKHLNKKIGKYIRYILFSNFASLAIVRGGLGALTAVWGDASEVFLYWTHTLTVN